MTWRAGLCAALIVSLLVALQAQSLTVRDSSTTVQVTVDANGNLRMSGGAPGQLTYLVSALPIAVSMTLLVNQSLYRWRLTKYCVGAQATITPGQAAVAVSVSLNRAVRDTTNVGGNPNAEERPDATTNQLARAAKADYADSNIPAQVYNPGTVPTLGALLAQDSMMLGETGAGTADFPALTVCRSFGEVGDKMPTVYGGLAASGSEGLVVNWTTGAGGGISAARVTFTVLIDKPE